MTERVGLERSISFSLLVLYGVGTMVGGGFYALIGKVAGLAGMHAPLAVLGAALLALASALSFAELSSRYPFSAGESLYVDRAFGARLLSIGVGWLVIATGVVSAATLANAIVVFLQDQFDLDRTLGILTVVGLLGGIAAWGIGESVLVAVTITVIEVGGLIYLVVAASGGFLALPERAGEIALPSDLSAWSGIGLGGFVIFYAFLGFEDLVNMAEEVKRPRRNLPRAILLSLAVTTGLYLVVTAAAILTLSPAELGASANPLADVVDRCGGHRAAMVAISVLAGVNGALVQFVMASRVAYGMSDKGLGPKLLASVASWTRTPLWATGLVTSVVLVLALWFDLVVLAQITSVVILVIFAVVNLALWRIQRLDPDPGGEGPRYPRWIPALGFLASAGFLVFRALG